MSIVKTALVTTALLLSLPVMAHAAKADKGLEHLSDVGRDAIAMYGKLPGPKALALAEDGAVGYSSGIDNAEARVAALARCAEMTSQTCRIISVDGVSVTGVQSLGELARAHTDSTDLRDEARIDYEKAAGAKALAMSENGAFGWVVRDSEDQARTDALRQCEIYGANCTVQSSSAEETAP